MQAHPVWPQVKDICEKYPDQAGCIWQAYLDLTLSQRWDDVEIHDLVDQQRCYITGVRPKHEGKQVVYPMHLSRSTSIAEMHNLFDVIKPAPERIFLAVCAEDSSVVYYKIGQGIVPPKEVKEG